MRKLFLAGSILVSALVTIAFSQARPVPAATRDTAQSMMNTPAPAGPSCMNGQTPGMSGQQCGSGYYIPNGMCTPGMMASMCGPFRRLMLLPFFFLGFMLLTIAIVNILLTILVCIDMSQLGRFNGLWIPILLLFGIPGTAIYALFRIGDAIRAAAK